MARTPEGWKLKWKTRADGTEIAHVRFRFGGRRQTITTGTSDPEQAPILAARIYADVVSGRVRKTAGGALVHPGTATDGLVADWLAAIENEISKKTFEVTYPTYGRHWSKAMPTIGDITDANVGVYQRDRLGHVQRETVKKERGAFRRFCGWLVETKALAEVPAFPKLGKAPGKRHKQGRRKPQSVLSPAEVRAVIGKLTDRTRDFYVVLYETGLPPSTIGRLVPSDLTELGLWIRPENDKNAIERTIPITARAREALARSLPFGEKDRREGLARAIRLALGASRRVTAYDFKHAIVTHKQDAGAPILGLSFATGRTAATLQASYSHPTFEAAQRAMLATGGSALDAENPEQLVSFGSLLGPRCAVGSCEGRDLNPHGCYTASTSSKFYCANPPQNENASYQKPAENIKPARLSGPGTQSDLTPELWALALAAERLGVVPRATFAMLVQGTRRRRRGAA